MKEKMRTVLRIAAVSQHPDLCMGAFGVGPGFRNPVAQVASMWRDILFSEEEFQGAFANIVFAIESSPSCSPKGSSTDLEVFRKNSIRPTLSERHTTDNQRDFFLPLILNKGASVLAR